MILPIPVDRTVPDHTVIIPAHDEAAAITQVLHAIGADQSAGHRQVIVACNACTDDTAALTRAAAPSALVIDLAEGGKWRAINAGLSVAIHPIVIVLDADVGITGHSLDGLARVLDEDGVWAASPAVEFDLAACDRWVAGYYRVFARHHYLRSGVGGSGVYGLSARGRAELGPLPRIISDDGFVRTMLPEARQRRVCTDELGNPVVSRVRPPRSVGELLRSEARWRRGDRELAGMAGQPPRRPSFLLALLARGEIGLVDALCYITIKLLGRWRMNREAIGTDRVWHKDLTSRGNP